MRQLWDLKLLLFFVCVRREIDEAMASASAEGRMEEEVKGECELEREEGIRWDIEKKELIAEECENERDYENE